MKKLIFLITILACMTALNAQTSTIVDNGPYITIQHQDGDTICVGKDNVVQVIDHNSEVFLMTSRKWSPGLLTKIISLKASDYGYSTVGALRTYLAIICFEAYRETYVYTGGNLDSVKHYVGSNLQYQIAYTYSDGTVVSKTFVNSQ